MAFDFEATKVFLFGLFVIMPIATIIHEFGHAFFALLLGGGNNFKLIIGSGKPIFSIGIVEFRMFYYWAGHCGFDGDFGQSKVRTILMLLGGAIFNLISLLIVLYFFGHLAVTNIFIRSFLLLTPWLIIMALLPMEGPKYPMDGLKIYRVLKGEQRQYRYRRQVTEVKS